MICAIKNDRNKWIAETVIDGQLYVCPPQKTKAEAEALVELKILESKVGNSGQRLMCAAIVKGLMEHKDGTRYFGSTMSFTSHLADAIKFGYVTDAEKRKVTPLGKEWYERCLKELPQKRQVYWGADGVGFPNVK